jgi:hypothetical protein
VPQSDKDYGIILTMLHVLMLMTLNIVVSKDYPKIVMGLVSGGCWEPLSFVY